MTLILSDDKELKKQKAREYSRKWYLEHKDRARERCKKYRLQYKDKITQYYKKHRLERIEYKRQYRLEHKEEIRESSKKYRQEHKNEIVEYRIKRDDWINNELIEILTPEGQTPKCVNPDCSCTDKRLFHVHHINGDGKEDRKRFGSHWKLYYTTHPEEARQKLQILCYICHNWKKIKISILK